MTGSYLRERLIQVFIWSAVALLTLVYVLTGLMYQTPASVSAAEVTDRSLELGTSEEDAETTHTVQFDVPAGTTMGAFRVEFCDDSPLAHTTCNFDNVGDDIPQIDANAGSGATLDGTSSVTNATAGGCDTLTLGAITAGDRYLEVTCTAADNLGGLASTVTLVFNNVDNPDNTTDGTTNNSFYARVYVYSDETPPAIANPVATTEVVHTGGLVASTAEQLTITARVQEILEFCVGTTPTAAGIDECVDVTGNAVDMGVLDFASVNQSTTETPASQGSIMVRTNASVGVVVDYFAEQDATGTNHEGALRVQGATCDATVPSTDETDQCINSVGIAQSVIAAGVEEFGFCVFNVDQTNGSADGGTVTSNLTADAEYDGTTSGCLVDGVAFDETGTTDTIATSVGSGGVINDEMLEMDFLGTADITTPSGLYSVVLTFVGTATF